METASSKKCRKCSRARNIGHCRSEKILLMINTEKKKKEISEKSCKREGKEGKRIKSEPFLSYIFL